MKKILFFFSFIFLLLTPSFCFAQAQPSISPSVLTLVNEGITSLNVRNIASEGVIPFFNGDINTILGDRYSIDTTLEASDFSVRQLSEIEKNDINSGFTSHFYDASGNEISLDDLYVCTANNGYYNSVFYIDSDGNVLFSDPTQTHTLLSLGYNGDILGDSWSSLFSELSESITNNYYNYYPDSENFGLNTFFIRVGGANRNLTPNYCYHVFVANQYIPGLIVPSYNGSRVSGWYTNDTSLFDFEVEFGNPNVGFLYAINSGHYTVDNENYSYYIELKPGYNSFRTDVSYLDFVNGNYQDTNSYAFLLDENAAINAQPLNKRTYPFRRLKEDEMPQLNPNEYYDYDELALTEAEPALELDPSYVPASELSPFNYPYYYISDLTNIIPSSSPLPGVNPGINPNPSPSGALGTIDPSVLGNNIPFISNLERRFPFSIPFDIYNLLSGLAVNRQTPFIDTTIHIPAVNIDYHLQLDLHEFDNIASLFRTLFLISFIIGLAYFSYEHFFGK